jgi:hypothetical protein
VTIADALTPRQHEGVDVEGVAHCLNLDSGQVAELHGRQLEFQRCSDELS